MDSHENSRKQVLRRISEATIAVMSASLKRCTRKSRRRLSQQSGLTVRPCTLDIKRFTDEAWFYLSGYGNSDTHYQQLAMPHPDTPGVTSAHDVMSLCSTRNTVKSYQCHPIVSSVRDLRLNILFSLYTGFWWGNLRKTDHVGDFGVEGRIILRWILRK